MHANHLKIGQLQQLQLTPVRSVSTTGQTDAQHVHRTSTLTGQTSDLDRSDRCTPEPRNGSKPPENLLNASSKPFQAQTSPPCWQCCWRKIRTPRQEHSKPSKLASHTSRFQSVPVNFPWKLTKDKVVKYQRLELSGWYQTVPYLRLESHVRWHIAMRSHLSTD
jgi:hypothetical protein